MLSLLLFAVGMMLLVYSAGKVVKYAVLLAKQLGMDRYGMGAGILATITSMPELVVAVTSILNGEPDIAVGTAFGSVVGLYLLSLGILGLIGRVSFPKKRRKELIRAMIIVVLVTVIATVSGRIGPLLGMILIGTYFWYAHSLHEGRIQSISRNGKGDRVIHHVLMLVGAFLLLILSAELVVKGAAGMAEAVGIPEFFVAFFLVALGTNLPEISVEVSAAIKGHEEIAIGDILGSGVADLTLVLGAAAITGWMAGNPVVFDGKAHIIAAIMLGISLIGLKIGKEEKLSVWEAVGLIIAYIFVVWTELIVGL